MQEHSKQRVPPLDLPVSAKADACATRSGITVACYAAADTTALCSALYEDRRGGDGTCRVALLDPTPARRARADQLLRSGAPLRGQLGIYFSNQNLLGQGKRLAFLFPGFDARFAPRLDGLERFGIALPVLTEAREPGAEALNILRFSEFMRQLLMALGIEPQAVLGHSVGDMSAMIAAGMLDASDAETLFAMFGPKHGRQRDDIAYLAVPCGAERALAIPQDQVHALLSHDNCPQQSIIAVLAAELERTRELFRAVGLECQVLPFHTGMHTPFFAEHLPRYRQFVHAWVQRAPRLAIYSATTCARYPDDLAGLREVMLEHFVKPVRFRATVERLYADGVAVFLQCGTGSLTHFVQDTLRERQHLALSGNVAPRSGLEQLVHVLAGLWTEGADSAFAKLGVTEDLCQARGQTRKLRRRIDLARWPELRDHALHRQPADWRDDRDRDPVVPLAGMLEWLISAVEAWYPGLRVIEVHALTALRWLRVANPIEIEIACMQTADARVEVAIVGYATATMLLAASYPAAPTLTVALDDAEHTAGAQIYDDRILFHGPAYRGLLRVDAKRTRSMVGSMRCSRAPGALLDNGAQILGLWFMLRASQDRLLIPTGVQTVKLYGPQPEARSTCVCEATPRAQDERSVLGDFVIAQANGSVWAEVIGWHTRRLVVDERFWRLVQCPERTLLAKAVAPGVALFHDCHRDHLATEYLSYCYLDETERQSLARQDPKLRRDWLGRRIAARDAARDRLWGERPFDLFPLAVRLTELRDGLFHASVPGHPVLDVYTEARAPFVGASAQVRGSADVRGALRQHIERMTQQTQRGER